MFLSIKYLLLINFLFILHIKAQDKQKNSQKCNDIITCADCLNVLECVWCVKPNDGINCISSKSINKCPPNELINPRKQFQITEDNRFSSGVPPVQIKPQKMKLSMRKDDMHEIQFQFKRAKNYPVDLYFLMDFSASMQPHKDALAALSVKISNRMKANTNDFRMGLGSFVDKPTSPYISVNPLKIHKPCDGCVEAYSFKHHLSLQSDDRKFSEMVKKLNLSGNVDAPEGGFDALMQVMLCDKLIGWRNHSRHLIVFSTDSYYHSAGDGKLGGVVEPNDAKCHMKDDEYKDSLRYDYPSVSHINFVAKQKNFNLIFAISKDKSLIYETYEKLTSAIENSKLGNLRTDIDKLIDRFYKEIVETLEFKVEAPNFVEVKFSGDCDNSNKCRVNSDKTINLNVQLRAIKCSNKTEIIKIKPGVLNEALEIELNILCDCKCGERKRRAPECNYRGDLDCGVCICNSDYGGKYCQCVGNSCNGDEECRNHNSTIVCSGRGVCIFGKCECYKRAAPEEEITGKYCECDNFSCSKNDDQICSGPKKGNCVCGKCVCLPGFSGEACECNDNIDSCIAKESEKVCSGNGNCVCGECQCKIDKNRYSGHYCEENINEGGKRCKILLPCVQCKVFNETVYNEEECLINCNKLNIMTTDLIEENQNQDDKIKICRFVDSGCTTTFQYEVDDEFNVKVQKTKTCRIQLDLLGIALIVVASIIAGGLIILIIWKIFTTVHDKIEYEKFETEKKKAKWSAGENPLYKGAISEFANPTYQKN